MKGSIVAKFGGSSLADGQQFQKVKKIILEKEERRVIVPSAPGKRHNKAYVPEQCNDEKLKKVLKVNDFRHFFLDFIIVTYYN